MDYETEKENFWRRNRFKDVYFNFEEKRTIPGVVHHQLIKMTDKEPCSVNFGLFFLFTIISFSEFYKIYANSFCVYQIFTIRKLVSTRYDLNQEVYKRFVPQVNLIVQHYEYQLQDYNHVNVSVEVKLPTEEELERAKKYQNKIPNYQLSSGNGNIHSGVILDNPSYSSYELNQPPAAFASVPGDKALNSNQITGGGKEANRVDKPGLHVVVSPTEDNLDEGSQQTTLQNFNKLNN